MAALVLTLCVANSSGPAANGNYYTGAPSTGGGTEFTCNLCHNSGVGNYGVPEVSWTIAATEDGPNETTYVPGATYFVTVNVTAPTGTPAGYGFSSTFLQDGTIDNAGMPASVDANTRITNAGNGRTYVEHNQRTPSGVWNFRWIAPTEGTGAVNIYSVGNAVNGMDSTGGDSGSPSSTVITLTEAVLPVNLTTFEATVDKATVRLYWQTATEEDVLRFEVERSTDGETFAPIGGVSAFGDSPQSRDYTFTDRDAPAGNLYYRLRTVDRDDAFVYGPVAQVRVTNDDDFLVYPNPASETVFVGGELNATSVIRILDGTGRTLRSRRGAGSLDVAGLPTGVYLVETVSEGARGVRKLVKR
jgi:hypothetical protein